MFESFTPISKETWLKKVEAELKGKTLESLNWESAGLSFSPCYHQEDAIQISPLGKATPGNTWEIGAYIYVEEAEKAQERALEALKHGAKALYWDFSTKKPSISVATLLRDIQPEWISMTWNLPADQVGAITRQLILWVKEQGFSPEKVSCTVPYFPEQNDLWESLRTQWPVCQPSIGLPVLGKYGEAETVEYLAGLLFQGNAYLESMSRDSAPKICFSLELGDSFYLNLAKIRALKSCWLQVQQAWDSKWIHFPAIEVHHTARTIGEDAHHNKIQASAQAFAAVSGGADRLYIYPSDLREHPAGTPFSRRIALNTQHLMQVESYMDQVADPAAGSYFLEAITQQLAEASWKRFQEKTKGQ